MAKRLKMSTSREVRRTVNRISNLLLNGELGAIRADEQQRKLDELEALVKELESRCPPKQ